jgi:hypothetical protein
MRCETLDYIEDLCVLVELNIDITQILERLLIHDHNQLYKVLKGLDFFDIRIVSDVIVNWFAIKHFMYTNEELKDILSIEVHLTEEELKKIF